MEFLVLLFAHLIADYPLQGSFLATTKGSNSISLVSHAGIWTGTIALTAYFLGMEITYTDIFLLFTVHTVADYLKAANKLFYKKLNPLGGGLLIDQMIHIVQLLVLLFMKGVL